MPGQGYRQYGTTNDSTLQALASRTGTHGGRVLSYGLNNNGTTKPTHDPKYGANNNDWTRFEEYRYSIRASL